MSQHSNLATGWEHLLGRNDLPKVLCEIIGQHALQCTLLEREPQPNYKAHDSIIWIKIIFDLQRCYMIGHTTSASDIPSQSSKCLLPPDLLLSSTLYLISVKSRITSSETTLVTQELVHRRLILAQAILSGLRLLLWHKECLSLHDKWRLQKAITDAWKDDNMRDIECCIVQQIFPAMMDVMKDSNHVEAYRIERENARLPTYDSGLVSVTYQRRQHI
jgi:hypothetical protein